MKRTKNIFNKLNHRIFFSIVLFALTNNFVLKAQSVANISIEDNAWSTSSGVVIGDGEIAITGNGSSYVTSKLTIELNSIPANLYFIAEVYLENIEHGSNEWDKPKFKMYDASTGSLYRGYNISSAFEGDWVRTGIIIEKFNKDNINSLTLEFGVQGATGTMKIRNPQLLSEASEGSYVFPYDVPSDPSVSLNILTSRSHTFQNDLLSANNHFSWASYDWGDQIVKDVLYNKFPMSNHRFPGGSIGNYYNYITDESDLTNGKLNYPGYSDVCKTLNASSTLMFNMIQDDAQKNADRLQSRLDDGLNVEWVELGNENGLGGNQNGGLIGEDITGYITHTKEVTEALKAIDPNIKVAVNIDSPDPNWVKDLSAENYYDACVMHPYNGTKAFMLSEFHFMTMLQGYKNTQAKFQHFASEFPGKELICTEWGILNKGAQDNFVHVLGLADMFLAIEKGNADGIVQQAGLHMFYHSDQFNDSRTMVYYDGKEMRLTAVGAFYSKLYEVFLNNKVYDAYSNSAELETDLDAVYAKAIDAGDSIMIYVVNKLPVASPLDLKIDGTAYTSTYKLETFTNDVYANRTFTYSVNENPWVTSNGIGTLSIPANSIGIVSIPKSNDAASNALINGDFTTGSIAPWEFFVNSAEASASIINEELYFDITSAGEESYQPQVIQRNLSIEGGAEYTFSLDAKADSNRTIFVAVSDGSDNIISETLELTTSMQSFQFQVTPTTSSINALVRLNVGANNHNVTFDNVKLETVLTKYELNVNKGEGDGLYIDGAVVNISADLPPSGQIFNQWTGDVAHVSNINDANTALTMPANKVSITATYLAEPTYTLTVNNGSGNGTYVESTFVNITADAPESGQVFIEWTGDVANIDYVNNPNASIFMPAANTSITATYATISSLNTKLYKQFKIYPNPTSGILNTYFEDSYSINIYNQLGVLVHSANNLIDNESLDLTKLKNGMYIIQLNSNSCTKTKLLQIR